MFGIKVRKTSQKVEKVSENLSKGFVPCLKMRSPRVTKCLKSKRPKAIEHADYLSLLGKTKNKKRRSTLIDFASKDQLEAVIECVENILQGTIPLSRSDARKLQRHKTPLRLVAVQHVPINEKRRVLKQQGGFLGALIPLAVSALGSLFGGLVGKR